MLFEILQKPRDSNRRFFGCLLIVLGGSAALLKIQLHWWIDICPRFNDTWNLKAALGPPLDFRRKRKL